MTVHTAWLAYQRALWVRVSAAHPTHETQMLLTYLSAQARRYARLAVVLDHTRLTDVPPYTALAGATAYLPNVTLALVYAQHPLLRFRVDATLDLLEIQARPAGTVSAAYTRLQHADPTLPAPLPPDGVVWLTRIRGATVTDMDGPPNTADA